VKAALTTALFIGLLAAGTASHAADSAVRYVRDWLSIPLRASAAPDSAVVHRGLDSGSAVTLLESDAKSGLSRVRSADGVEGWIASRYLVTEPTARQQLETANAEIAQLRQLNEQLKNQQPPEQRQLAELQANNVQLQSQLSALQQGPNGIKQLRALQQQNAQLQKQITDANGETQMLRGERETTQFRNGALAVIAGALLTLIIPRLWPKKKSEWS
jgi:SH3 domain protein